tara:strand:+ start:635 stop:973 length:339 start_codon:yes stop_codon:yes gene_type:complete
VREAVTGDELQQVLRKLRDQALEGDTAAARLLIERTIGKPSDEPRLFGVELTDLETPVGIAESMRRVAAAAAIGDISANDASAVVGVLRECADATAFAELEQRIEQLEADKL